MKYWIFKSEPDTFSIDDLQQRDKQIEPWNGVRNYQARNFLRDEVKKGDLILFHHSSCKEPGIVGIATVIKEAYPDTSAQDSKSDYYDKKSSKDNPIWVCVDVKFVKKFKRNKTLKLLKTIEQLKDLILLRKGNRLSIMPISKDEYDFIVSLED